MPKPDQTGDVEQATSSPKQQTGLKPLAILAEATKIPEGTWANKLASYEVMDPSSWSYPFDGALYSRSGFEGKKLGESLREGIGRKTLLKVTDTGEIFLHSGVSVGLKPTKAEKGREGTRDTKEMKTIELRRDSGGHWSITMERRVLAAAWSIPTRDEINITFNDGEDKPPKIWGSLGNRNRHFDLIPREEIKKALEERFGVRIEDLARYPIDGGETMVNIIGTDLQPDTKLGNLLGIDEMGDTPQRKVSRGPLGGKLMDLPCLERHDLEREISKRELEHMKLIERHKQYYSPLVDDEVFNKIQTPETKNYSPEKIDGDYELFLQGTEGYKYDPSLSTQEKQQALFALYVAGEVSDPIQAYEWLLGGKWDEWTEEQKKFVASRLSEPEKAKYGHLLGVAEFDPNLGRLESRTF